MFWDNFLFVLLPLCVGVSATLLFAAFGEKIGLVDYPNHRKLHQKPTMTTGGISIFMTVLLCSLLLLRIDQPLLVYLACGSMLVILGLLDDLTDLPAVERLVAQAVIALLMCSQAGLIIEDLGNLFGFGNLHLDFWGNVLTIIAVIAAINAFNMIDGIDGLLGCTALITFSGLALLFVLSGDFVNFQFSLLFALALLPYLWANLQIKPVWMDKIFMGDTGSMLIGFTVVWLLISGSQGSSPSFSVTTALWLICFPLMDMVRVMLTRKLRGRSMMVADRSHLHHILTDQAIPVKHSSLLLINVFSITSVCIGILLEVGQIPEQFSLMLFLVGFLFYSYSIYRMAPESSVFNIEA